MLELPNYSSQLMQQLWALRNGKHFCDCTVLVGDSPHRAHKLVLAASSMLFRSLLAISDTISIDTAVVSSQEFSCLLNMVYTGKLPLGKHNVSRIIAAADNLQMFDVAIGFKKVLSTIVNPQPSLPDGTDQSSSQDEMKMDCSDSSTTPKDLPNYELPSETKSPSEKLLLIKKNKEEDQKDPGQRVVSDPILETGFGETLKKDTEDEASLEQHHDAVLKVLEHFPVISELLNKLPNIQELLSQAAESLDKQDNQVVITCCEKADTYKVVEVLLSHVEKGVLSEASFIRLLKAVHLNTPLLPTQLQSLLQQLENDTAQTAAPNQLKDSNQRSSEAEDTKEEDRREEDTKEDTKEENSITEDSDDYEVKEKPSSASSRNSSTSKKFTCRTCKRTFDYKCRLKAHMKRCFKSKRPQYQCPQCPEKLSTNQALMHHQIQVHKFPIKKKVECELCGRKFAHPSGMIYHMRSEHFEEKPFSCKECGTKFAAKSSLKNHMRLHTGEKPYSCKECEMSFAVAAGLAYHIKKKHAQGKMYACQYCKAAFAQSIELTRHVRTHTGDRPYVCRECGKGYCQAKGLTDHLQTAHNSGEQHDCQKCCLSFTSLTEHQQHIQEVHPSEFHQCPECEKVFPTVSLLNKHKSTHFGSKLFSCDLCNKSYQQLSGLWYHNRTTHPELFSNHTRQLKALVQCNICFKFFPNDESLAQHQAIEHEGSSGSALRCPFCPAAFAGQEWMQEHISTHHAEQSETMCLPCLELYATAQELQDHMLTVHMKDQERQAEQEEEAPTMEVPAEAKPVTREEAEQMREAECLQEAEATTAADLVRSQGQSHLESAEQVFVALADGQGSSVVEVSMFDLLNNSVTFICEEGRPGTSTQT
ncbi:zinc finger and BTB domain-containing protein 40 [Periophthalmus magnuspinnatus]|uniref:zinc finger and BTB domain-containing protein 40 n=1 Tax=Periophthalmus magnuspinnatus TaxID=409849 RepID=UPI002436E194|nr:zinc finger and BTB domain-containing protein 40 [Periophthalmus magnuspinnatus]